MEVELGIKITKTRDDVTSISDFQFAKDRAGPVFLSKETDTAFILTAHFKGYKEKNIHIKISQDGTQISVSGEKAVQEMGMIPFKKEVKIKGFKKKFKIPDGVVLDRIKANYKEEESILIIAMPKMAKGISGVGIDEVPKPEPSVVNQVLEPKKSVAVQVPEPEESVADQVPEPKKSVAVQVPEPEESVADQVLEPKKSVAVQVPESEESVVDEVQEPEQSVVEHVPKPKQSVAVQVPEPEESVADDVQEPEQSVVEQVPEKTGEETSQEKKRPRKPWKPCPPLFLGGSTLLVSLIFLVIHFIRMKKN